MKHAAWTAAVARTAARAPSFAAARTIALAWAAAVASLPWDATRASAEPARVQVVDDFEDADLWTSIPADGVDLAIVSDTGFRGRCIRLDFDFHGGGGYAVARRALDLELPENYVFSFRIRGAALPNHLEFKLVDASGDNVWWHVRRDVQFPENWQVVTIKKRQVAFAWGPRGGGELRHAAALEFAITAGSGGRGSVWIDALELRALPPPDATPPAPRPSASSAEKGRGATRALDGDATTAWESARGDAEPWIGLDLGGPREFGALVLDWLSGRHAADYDVEISDDGAAWRSLRAVRGGNGGRDWHFLPESEAAHLRLRLAGKHAGTALAEIAVMPLDWAPTREKFFEHVARASPRGTYPRAIAGEQSYWTVVGLDGDDREALLGEDGALEIGRGGCSVEPFLFHDGRLVTWADVQLEQSLADGDLPMPRVRWQGDDLTLDIEAFASGSPGYALVVARYVVTNRQAQPKKCTLYLAIRPFQVNPPAQFLNLAGGTAPIRSLAFRWLEDAPYPRQAYATIDGRSIVAATPPSAAGAVHFDGGDIVADHLRAGRVPEARAVEDGFGAASGAFAFDLEIDAGATAEIALLVPMAASVVPVFATGAEARDQVAARRRAACDGWRARLDRVGVQLPDTAVAQSLRAQLGWILVNRAGPAIQPGTRSYARSWIRDGAMTSSALLRLGHEDAVRDFIEWFAPHQYANGKIPCVVDARGADPTPEHDSSGEFVFLVAEYWRYTGDRDLTTRMWPRVRAAVAYLDSLRNLRRTPEFAADSTRHFYGLLPPSISHEGYSAKPMHSYWDVFWAVRGFRDAAFLADALGLASERDRIAALGRSFEADVAASIAATLAHHRIDFVPGCADLGDFDATSTTVLLSPVQAASLAPAAAVQRTFEKYHEFFVARRAGAAWEAYTPYEMRNIGAYVHLGWRERAAELLEFFLADQRPRGFRQWPEIVWHEARVPRFLGDLPHGWVGSDYVRSVLDMLAYERDRDRSLVVAAGVPQAWLEGPGVTVRDLRTPYGRLSYTLRRRGDTVVARIEAGLRMPPGGIVLQPPLPWPTATAALDGRRTPIGPQGEIVIRRLPAEVVLRP